MTGRAADIGCNGEQQRLEAAATGIAADLDAKLAAIGSDCDGEWLRREVAATGRAANLGGDGERLLWEGWQTLAAIRSGGYSDVEGGGPWRRRRAAAMGMVADLGGGREGRGPWRRWRAAATGQGRAATGRAANLCGD